MPEFVVNFEKKRPAKRDVVSFLNSSFAAHSAGVPGATIENIANQVGYANNFLYETEVKELIDKMSTEADKKKFLEFLRPLKCVAKGAPKAFGGGGGRGEGSTTIDSEERAAEVANTPEDVPIVISLVKQMLDLRKKLNPHINLKSECSIALKNKKSKKDKEAEVATGQPQAEAVVS